MVELKMQIDPDYVPENHFEVQAIVGFYKHFTMKPCVSYYRVVWKNYKRFFHNLLLLVYTSYKFLTEFYY
jgi:hypothetical protein